MTNRGFMRGPFLPIYGSGAIMMLVVSMPFQDNIVMTYAAGCVGATVLEYVTGVVMEALFQVRYWDYSDKPFNFQGHVCLGTTLSWGFLTILMTEAVHVPVERMVLSISGETLTLVTFVLTGLLFADFALSFKAAMDLRNVLIRMEQVKEEMVHIQKRLDAIFSQAGHDMAARRTALTESVTAAGEGMAMHIEDVKNAIESRLDAFKHTMLSKPLEYRESVREELMELKEKYAVSLESRKRLSGLKDFFLKGLIRSNPYMTSRRYKESLEEVKRSADRKAEEDGE